MADAPAAFDPDLTRAVLEVAGRADRVPVARLHAHARRAAAGVLSDSLSPTMTSSWCRMTPTPTGMSSVGYLKRRGVDLIIVHGALLGPDEFGATTAALLARPDIEAVAQFEEPMGLDAVFRLRR